MKKTIAILLSILLVLSVTGCQGSGEVPQEETDEITLTTLASSTEESDALQEMEEQYEAETGIKVNIDVTHDTSEAGMEAFQQRVNTELMAKEGADIYGLNFLDYQSLGEQGLLYDFSSMMEEDDYLNDEHVYMKVIEAMARNEHIYCLPMDYYFSVLLASSEEASAIGDERAMTWPEFIEEANKLEHTGYLFNSTDGEIFIERLYDNWKELINETEETSVDIDRLAEIFEEVKAWKEQQICYNVFDTQLDISKTENSLYQIYVGTYDALILLDDTIAETVKEKYPNWKHPYFTSMPSDQNQKGYRVLSTSTYGINASSKHRKEAIDFLKYIMQSYTSVYAEGFWPIDRKSMRTNIGQFIENYIEKNEIAVNVEEVAGKIEKYLEEIKFAPKIDQQVIDTIYVDGALEYFQGNKTLDEILKEIEEKVTLYYKEKQ